MRDNRIQIPQMDKYPTHDPRFYPTRPATGGKANLASCLLATAFLILIVLAAAATLFFLFRPKDPTIHVTAVHLPGFSVKSSDSNPNVVNGFSFSAYAAVTNPNRAAFSHYDSSIRLLTGGAQVGFMYIPAGEIAGGRTQFMEATFSVGSFPISASAAGIATVELDSRVELKGRVRVLKIFVHRVTVVTECRISTFSVGSFPISASAVGRAGGRNGGGGGRGGRQGGTGFIVRFFWSGLVLMGRGLSLTCQLSGAYLACQLSTLTVHVSS